MSDRDIDIVRREYLEFVENREYSPEIKIRHVDGTTITFINRDDGVNVNPDAFDDGGSFCAAMAQGASPTACFDIIEDAIRLYMVTYGPPKNLYINFQYDISVLPGVEENLLARGPRLGYNLLRKMNKVCGECEDTTQIYIFEYQYDT